MIYPVTMGTYLEEDQIGSYSDEELLAASIAHPSLFVHLVRKYEAPFLRKALSIVRSKEEAEDVVQEAFTKIYLNAKKFKKVEGATFSSWGYRIVVNTALTHYMKGKRERGVRADLEPEILELIPDKSVEQFGKKELSDVVASVLRRMPDMFANALAAFFIEGKTQEEIAEAEGVSVGAIKTRVHRAKQEFKKVYNSIHTP
jgi:RNA polymerase sigma-70 factor (ECF subfamily)